MAYNNININRAVTWWSRSWKTERQNMILIVSFFTLLFYTSIGKTSGCFFSKIILCKLVWLLLRGKFILFKHQHGHTDRERKKNNLQTLYFFDWKVLIANCTFDSVTKFRIVNLFICYRVCWWFVWEEGSWNNLTK